MATDKNGKVVKVGDSVNYKGRTFKVTQVEVFSINDVWSDFNNTGNPCWVGGKVVELVSQGPVRETTIVKKEIVPGLYGSVSVSKNTSEGIAIHVAWTHGKAKIAEIIKTLQTVHDAVED